LEDLTLEGMTVEEF
jgi:hypothetical protein